LDVIERDYHMILWAIILFLLAILSFSLYLTPTPISKRSVVQFLQFFLFQWMVLVGFFMTLPYMLDWKLPLQQGLGDSFELLLRGALLAVVCIFCLAVTRMESEGALPWIKAILLLIIGLSEFNWVWDFMDSSVNGVLNAANMPMKALYAIIFPYILLLFTYVLSFSLGSIFLIANGYRVLKNQ
jgi:hypothetical protein